MRKRRTPLNKSRFRPRANLDGKDLSNLELHEVNLEGASLRGANLNGSDLTLANFASANLEGATFVGAYLNGCSFRSANLNGADFGRATIRTPFPHPNGRFTALEEIQNVVIPTTWRYQSIESPNLYPPIEQKMFANAQLRKARFFRTAFYFGVWERPSVTVSEDPKVWVATGFGDFRGVSFENADLTGAEFIENEICDYETIRFQIRNRRRRARRALKKGTIIYETFNVDFTRADLTGATFRFVNERALNPDTWNGFEDSYKCCILGLTSAKMDGTSFIGDLSTVDLVGSDLEDADLSNAINYDPTTTLTSMGKRRIDPDAKSVYEDV